METKLIVEKTLGRTLIGISIYPNEQELERANETNIASAESQSPFPCQVFQEANPQVKTIKGLGTKDGEKIKIYYLSKARRVLLNRPLPGKTAVRVPFGETTLGYINERELPSVATWWEKARKEMTQNLKERLYNISQTTFETCPTKREEIVESTGLNPLGQQNKQGVRKRTLDSW